MYFIYSPNPYLLEFFYDNYMIQYHMCNNLNIFVCFLFLFLINHNNKSNKILSCLFEQNAGICTLFNLLIEILCE